MNGKRITQVFFEFLIWAIVGTLIGFGIGWVIDTLELVDAIPLFSEMKKLGSS